jgi:hypothetical protein
MVAASTLAKAVEYTRGAIVGMGEQIHAQLDREQRDALGIHVSVVTRTDGGLWESENGLDLQHLPTIDEGPFERRAGATALYLEAFRGTEDRIMLQIQSTPGVLVAATSRLDELELWCKPVPGIIIDDAGAARLVTQIVTEDGRDVQTRRGADARVIVEVFPSGGHARAASAGAF